MNKMISLIVYHLRLQCLHWNQARKGRGLTSAAGSFQLPSRGTSVVCVCVCVCCVLFCVVCWFCACCNPCRSVRLGVWWSKWLLLRASSKRHEPPRRSQSSFSPCLSFSSFSLPYLLFFCRGPFPVCRASTMEQCEISAVRRSDLCASAHVRCCVTLREWSVCRICRIAW